MKKHVVLFAICLGAGQAGAQVPSVPNGIPNVAQVPGRLLFRSAAVQNRITNIAYHNGSFYTNVVTGSDRKVWRFTNPANVASFAQDTTRNNDNIPLLNEHGNHAHTKSGDYLGGSYGMAIKRQSPGVNITEELADFQTFSHYSLEGHALYWPWRLPFHWIQYGGLESPTPTRIIRPGTTGPRTLFDWNSLAEDGVTGNSILLGNLLFVTSDESSLGILCYDISPVFKTPAERPILLDKLTGDFGAYIAVPFEHYIVLARSNVDKVEIVDFSDPSDLRHVASIDVKGNPSWAGDVNVPYTQAQDNFIFTKRHKIDMDSFTPVLELDQAGNNRPAGSVAGIVDTSQYVKPIGNLLVTAGYSFEQSDRLAVWAHQAAPDTRRPYVGYHVPRPGQTNFPLGAPISLLVHEALESYTIINGVTVILREVGTTTALDCWTSFAHDGVLTITPKVYLLPDKSYEVIVTDGGIKDALNNGIEPYTFSFSTGAGAAGGNASPVIAAFAASPSPAASGVAVSFTSTASDPESDALQYRINYGDGGVTTAWGSGSAFSHAYAAAGHYVVKLQVRDQKPGGAVSVVSKDLTVTIGSAPAGPAPKNSSTLALDAVNRRVWCANPDADTVSILNADTGLKTAEFDLDSLLGETAGVDPRNIALDASGNAWVTCHDADCVAILSPAGSLLARINTGYGSAPLGACATPAGDAVFITLTGSGLVKRYSVATRLETGSLALGPTPRAIAITGNGSRVLVTRYLSEANRGIVWEISNSTPLVLSRTYKFTRNLTPDSSNNGRGIPNQLAGITISPDNNQAWITGSKMNDEHGLFFTGRANTDNAVRAMVVRLDLNSGDRDDSEKRLDVDNSESPTSVAFSPIGDWAFVTLQGNNQVAVYDNLALNAGASKATRWRFNTGLAPQGQVFDAVSKKLFVNNFMSREISIHDLTAFLSQGTRTGSIVKTAAVASETLAPNILAGKKTFYNASLKSGNGEDAISRDTYVSCATCHTDGAQDGRVWDFTQRGEGFRNTIDLRGRIGMGHGNVHWSANFDEIQDFENDIRDHFGGTGLIAATTVSTPFGTVKAGQSVLLDDLTAYLSSLSRDTLPKSPHRAANGMLSAAAIAGQAVFTGENCASCHGGGQMTDSTGGFGIAPTLHDVGTLRTTSGGRLGAALPGIDTPTLAGIHATAPYFHDGSAPALADVFTVAGGTTYQAEDGTLAGSVIRPGYININYYNMVQKGGLVEWQGNGTWTMPNVDGGPGGIGAVEFRFASGSILNVTVRVNSTNYPLQLRGQNPGWQFDHYTTARLEGIALTAGATNTVSITQSQTLGIDSMTVSTAAHLVKAQPHRRVLALGVTDQANLLQYLRELDGSSIAAIVAPGGTGSGALIQFRQQNGLAADGSQDALTPAGDGVANLLKFAFNMIGNGTGQTAALSSPNVAIVGASGTAGLPRMDMDASGKLTFTYIRRKASSNPGVGYDVEFSGSLGAASWAVNPLATEVPESIDLTFERVTVTDSAAGTKRFARVRVTAF